MKIDEIEYIIKKLKSILKRMGDLIFFFINYFNFKYIYFYLILA